MNLFKDLADIFKVVVKKAEQHAPELLAGVGIAGFVSTTVIAVKAKPKADILVEEKKEELQIDKLKFVDTVKVIWKPYLPAVITGTASTICIVGSVSTSLRRNAVLSAAYTLATDAAKEYRDKVVEVIGESKEKEIREKVAQDRITKNPPEKSNEILVIGTGETLCHDTISGRYFKYDIQKLSEAINKLNYNILNDNYASLNDFYSLIGLPQIDLGHELGWSSELNHPVKIDYSSCLTPKNEPALEIIFIDLPKAGYDRFA